MKKHGIALLLLVFSVICNESAFGETIKEAIIKQERALIKADEWEKIEIFIRLSDLRLNNLLSGAAHDADQAYALAIVQDDPELIAKSALQKSNVFLADVKDVDSAMIFLKIAEENFRRAGKSNPAQYYYCLSKYYLYQNNIPSAISNARLAEQLATGESDLFTVGISRLILAKSFKAQNNRTLFLQYIKLAGSAFNESHDYLRSGGYFISISILLGDAGFSELALKNAIRGLSICESTYDSIPLGFLYANLSGLFGMNDKAKGVEYLEKSLAIFNALDFKKGISYSSNMLGMYYFGEKKYAESIEFFKSTLKFSIEINDLQTASFASNNLAEVMINLGRISEAEKYLNEAGQLADKSGDLLAKAVFRSTKGLFYRHLKKYQKSIEEYKISLDFSYKIQNANFVTENLKIIAEVYHLDGNEKKALEYYNMHIKARDSVANLAMIDKATDIRDNYLSELEEKKSGKTKFSYNNVIEIIGLIMILSIVVIGLMLRRNRINKNRFATEVIIEQSPVKEEINETKTPRMQLNEVLQKEIWEKLIILLETEHIYRNADLSLAELAEKLDSNTTYVSKVINDVADSNFTTFINRYRVEEACKLLIDPESSHLSIEGIAYTVGFHSKSAFNGAFKRNTGKTPSEYAAQKAAVS